MNNEKLIGRKDIKIENRSWDLAKTIMKKRKIDRSGKPENMGELVSELLIRHQQKEIDFQAYELEERKIRKIELNQKALDYYLNEIQTGAKTYLINGLLRTWLREQN